MQVIGLLLRFRLKWVLIHYTAMKMYFILLKVNNVKESRQCPSFSSHSCHSFYVVEETRWKKGPFSWTLPNKLIMKFSVRDLLQQAASQVSSIIRMGKKVRKLIVRITSNISRCENLISHYLKEEVSIWDKFDRRKTGLGTLQKQ